MKSQLLLKTTLLIFAPILWLSCTSWEEVVSPDEFKPLKITSIAPMTAKTGEAIVITGENFIKNKEYNQVWFGGNIRGIVDSATATKLFLKVPEGAQTGNISVSNGIYSDTLKSTFTIVKESPFKTASISFGGFKISRGIESTVQDGSSPSPKYSAYFDSISILKSYTIVKSSVPDKSTFFAIGCLAFGPETPFPDSVFQSYELKKNTDGDYTHQYYILFVSIDTTKKIISDLHIIRKELINRNSSGYSGYRKECKELQIQVSNIKYNQTNKGINFRLTGQEIATIFKLSIDDRYTYNSFTGAFWSETKNFIHKLYDIQPDAYFELTLE